MEEEKKNDETKENQPVVVEAEPVTKGSGKRPFGYWGSILVLVFAGLYLVQAVWTLARAIQALVGNANGNPTMSTMNMVGEFIFTGIGVAGFVLLLLSGLKALKKSKEPASVFADFGFIYFWIGLIVCLMAVTSLVTFGFDWKNAYGIPVAVASMVLGLICHQRKDGTILENQILFYVASGLISSVSALNLGGSFKSGWYSIYDVSHSMVPFAFYVVAVLSVVFEERKSAK
jgi:magnesium-transporting ATPase (P-type)